MDDPNLDPVNTESIINDERKCTINACQIDSGNHNLQCMKCKRKVHYKCTLLPLYQLQQFLSFGNSYRKYTCVNCIKVRKTLCDLVPEILSNEPLQLELANQRQLVKSYELELMELREVLIEYKNEESNKSTKKRKRNQENEDIHEQSDYTEEQNEIPNKEKVNTQQTSMYNYHEQLLENMKKMIDVQFDQMEHKISNIVNKKIKEKLYDQEQMQSSFAETLTKNVNEVTIEKAIRESLNKELVQDTERVKREKNIIIHGIVECRGTETQNQEHDEIFITKLLQIMGAHVTPVTIVRLGKPNEEKNRPVKVIMDSTEDKVQVMSRLVNLKNADELYKSISVKDDYTYEERETIKQWMQRAEEKNRRENTTDWKVRGNPKNGLRIVKVTKKKLKD